MVIEFVSESSSSGKIKVVGVGGAGCNAVDGILDSGLPGVELIAMNTDVQSLRKTKTELKVQLGESVTHGSGTGGNPELGKQAAEESLDLIRETLEGATMVFLTAGFGGGTGTGALPVIAKLAKDMGILTFAVITKPFKFERNRLAIAQDGIRKIENVVDALMVIPNDQLIAVVGEKATLAETFTAANTILEQAVSSISDLISIPGVINVDFASIRAVMANHGGAVIGIGAAKGPERATVAVHNASESGLLEKMKIAGAKHILLNIIGGPDMTIGEINHAADTVAAMAHPDANIIFGAVIDEHRKDEMKVTIIATGFESALSEEKAIQPVKEEYESQPVIDFSAPIEHPEKEEEIYTSVPIVEPAVVNAHETFQAENPVEEQMNDTNFGDAPLFAPANQEKENAVEQEVGINVQSLTVFSPTDYEIPAYLRKRKNTPVGSQQSVVGS